MAVTQEVVLNFLLEQGGKVKNSDLLKTFKPVLDSSDPKEKANNRELFKRFVNNIAVVRDEDGGKVVVLKKKFTHLLSVGVPSTNVQLEERESPIQEEPQPLPASESNTEEAALNTFIERPSQQDLPESQDQSLPELKVTEVSESACETSSTPELSNFSDSESVTQPENDSKRESVFAIVSRMDHTGPAPVPKAWSEGQTKEVQKQHMLPLRYAPSFGALEINQSESVPHLTTSIGVQQVSPPDLQQTPAVQEAPLPALPRSPHVGRRHLDEPGSKSPHIKRSSKLMKVTEDNKYSDVVPLIQHEHEWLVNATNGRWNHKLLGLMMVDSDMADKRDFISGFTALHWAAKSGNTEMMKLLFDLSRKGGANVNVNVRSFGGYTPLHIAAIHDRKEIILMLVRDYNAKIHVRDNSGRKPYHYLKKGSAMQLRLLLKDPNAIIPDHAIPGKRNSKVASSLLGTTSAFIGVISDDIAFQELTRGLKKPGSLNKFFTAPSGGKKKLKPRDSYPSISSLNEEPEEVEEMAGKRRPLSEFFTH
ncbi:ankyrin repeat domain-containing protein SOWAHA [Hyperolius riggenbachi]|uniref:ankyrin repeat domain-containing protein SOWAHA n=1 Tax=Hyperolius riggenbachi TaxID=752182 RepID=UPI0035A3AE92